MNINMLLEMPAGVSPNRIAIGHHGGGLDYQSLLKLSRAASSLLEREPGRCLVHVAETSPATPVAMFAAAGAGVPFVPVNYRLADDRLRALIERQVPALVIADAGTEHRVEGVPGVEVMTPEAFLDAVAKSEAPGHDSPQDPEMVAVLLYTSGTSGDPKAAILRHRHLSSYVIGSVEFLGADENEATLASVPPYHIAAVSGMLTAIYGGRRLVQLPAFDPHRWVELARSENITHAMTVPTMLARILDVLDPEVGGDGEGVPSLRHLSYGGGRMPVPVIERAMRLLPDVSFVNAYGLTETSSSIAVLTPDDHRAAMTSTDERVRRRLGSVGQPLPTVEISVRDEFGDPVTPGVVGEIWVRGEQVSGEYSGIDRRAQEGWFPTHDAGWFDDEGYLFVEGRLDDVIVRGGENLSPGEIEDVLLDHPAVREVVVLGIPDEEWGEVVAAVIVPVEGAEVDEESISAFVANRLRSSRRPARIEFRDELPMTTTGKVLRRVLRNELVGGDDSGATELFRNDSPLTDRGDS